MLKKYLSWEEHVKQVLEDNPGLMHSSHPNPFLVTQMLSQKLQNLPIKPLKEVLR